MNKETTTRVATAALAFIGVLLAVAESIKDIPALAPYSNWATAVVGLAVAMKQIIQLAAPQDK
jgi:hypothetical protein